MTRSTVYLFPDTNLFIQCQPLDQLDWSAWSAFNEVILIVSRPVLREIDSQKNKGNERIGKRARSTSSLFRKIIVGEHDHKIFRDSGPRVKLVIEPEHGCTEGLPDLNYEERDDQLVGTLHKFAETYPDKDARLLTHDGTPLAIARSLGLKADVISDDWLLPPESTQVDKKIAALEAENARLKRAEPSFQVTCWNREGTTTERLETKYTWFEPLTDTEVNKLMDSIKARFPIETDFGSREPARRDARIFGSLMAGMQEEFVPATDEEIATYRNESYPKWLKRCEETLRNYHHTLQREAPIPAFAFVARNDGTRPAKDALISIEAQGNFEIKPPERDDRDHDDEDEIENRRSKDEVALPYPPTAPSGRWRTSRAGGLGDALESFEMLRRSLSGLPGMTDPVPGTLALHRGLLDPAVFRPPRHDPNAFYYKPERPVMPQAAFSLECDQWRHDDEDMTFAVEIYLPRGQDLVEGAVECQIQAENLSQAASCLVPVRITARQISTFERAQELVKNLID